MNQTILTASIRDYEDLVLGAAQGKIWIETTVAHALETWGNSKADWGIEENTPDTLYVRLYLICLSSYEDIASRSLFVEALPEDFPDSWLEDVVPDTQWFWEMTVEGYSGAVFPDLDDQGALELITDAAQIMEAMQTLPHLDWQYLPEPADGNLADIGVWYWDAERVVCGRCRDELELIERVRIEFPDIENLEDEALVGEVRSLRGAGRPEIAAQVARMIRNPGLRQAVTARL